MSYLNLLALICLLSSTIGFAAATTENLPARSEPQRWRNFYRDCDDFLVPDFENLTEDWQAWQVKANAAMKEVGKLTSQTCPTYFKKKQGGDEIKHFSEENDRVGNLAVIAGKEGRPISRYLDQKFRNFEAAAKSRGRNFSNGRCGRIFSERRDFIARNLAELESKILDMEKSCNGISQKEAAETNGRKLAAISARSKPLAKVPGDKHKSTITGEIRSRR